MLIKAGQTVIFCIILKGKEDRQRMTVNTVTTTR